LQFPSHSDRTVRRVNTLFSLSEHWKGYDVFSKQKMSTFKSSRPAVLELAARYKELTLQLENHSSTASKTAEEIEAAEKLLFTEMSEICLWGNATDLSLLTSLTYEDIQKLQGSDARKTSEKNIVVNELPAAFKVLKAAQKAGTTERRVDIVLDNAGFELFVDLLLAGYLLSANLATTIVLHPKSLPWFVSDVVPGDFSSLLNALADPQVFYISLSDDEKHVGKQAVPLSYEEIHDLLFLFERWSGFHSEGQLVIRPNRFWTEAGSYWRLPMTAPRLFDDLKESELVLFKGDLNYRKLTGDVSCKFSTRVSDSDSSRRLGIQPRLSPKQSAHSAQAQVYARWLCALVKLMSWSDCLQGRMSVSNRWREGVVTVGRESGHGVANGQLCSFTMASHRLVPDQLTRL
jgi:damage-control phosphatase, subfamily III